MYFLTKIIGCFVFCVFLFFPAYSRDIVVVSSRDVSFFADTVQGIKSVISKQSDFNCDVIYLEDQNIIKQIGQKNYSLICTLGLSSTREVVSKIKDIPVIFGLILDPVGAGVVSGMDNNTGNVTGVSLNLSSSRQYDVVKKIFPAFKKAGLIYGNSSQSFYSELNSIIGVTASKASLSTQVPALMNGFNKSNIDFFWMVLDSAVYNKDSLAFVLSFCSEKQIPVIGFSPNVVKAGAIMAFTYDYKDIGSQMGDMILDVINGAKSPGSIAVASPRKVGYVLNMKVVRSFRYSVSQDVINSAIEVFD